MNEPSTRRIEKGSIKRAVYVSVLIATVLNGAYVFGSWQSVQPNGSDTLLTQIASRGISLYFIAAALGICHVVAGLLGAKFGWKIFSREHTVLAGIFVVVFLVFTPVGLMAGKKIRIAAFRSIAAKGEPLVKGLQQYQVKHGHPPERLEELVPEFVSVVPDTGIRTYPKFHFLRNPDSSKYSSNAWVLFVPVPIRDATHDVLVFFPNQAYPKNEPGRYIRRIGDWAYVMALGSPYIP